MHKVWSPQRKFQHLISRTITGLLLQISKVYSTPSSWSMLMWAVTFLTGCEEAHEGPNGYLSFQTCVLGVLTDLTQAGWLFFTEETVNPSSHWHRREVLSFFFFFNSKTWKNDDWSLVNTNNQHWQQRETTWRIGLTFPLQPNLNSVWPVWSDIHRHHLCLRQNTGS